MPRPLPQIVLVVGFAWGNPAHVNVGDIIIASKIHDVNHVRKENGKEKRRVADRVSAVGSVAEFLTGLPPSPHSVTGFLPSRHSGRVLCGELASAEIYLADSSERDAIIQQLPEVLGGEMEAFDVVRDLKVPWLLIKAISDDGGDGVDRKMQSLAAHAAANLVSPTLEVLTSEGILEPAREDVSVQHLIEALHGKALRISRPDGDRLAIVNAMNFEVPRIIQRLSNYASGQDGQDDLFFETLAVTMVEVAQNAFLHGSASYVNCDFNETSVSLDDDGTAYDPKALTGMRGGSISWKELANDYIANGVIDFESTYRKASGNSYKFKFRKIDFEIRKAMMECSVHVVSDGHGFKGSEITFDPICNTLYYDLGQIYSISKLNSVESELILLVESGKSVIVSCRDKRQAEKLGDALAEYRGPKLRLLVAGKA
jgi:nucleoside phosphorylase